MLVDFGININIETDIEEIRIDDIWCHLNDNSHPMMQWGNDRWTLHVTLPHVTHDRLSTAINSAKSVHFFADTSPDPLAAI